MLPQSTYGTHPKRFITLSLTNLCNSRCRHCSSGLDGKQDNELPFGDYVKFIRSAWETKPDFHVQITGGEPLLRREDCLKIIRELHYDGIYLHLATNGLLVKDGLPERLAEAGLDSLAISLDGPGHHHDWLRGVPQAYLRGIGALEQMGRVADRVRISVATVLYDRMLNELENFVRNILDIPYISHINLQAIFPDLNRFPAEIFYAENELWPRKFGPALIALDRIIELKKKGLAIKNTLSHLETMKTYFADPMVMVRGCCDADRQVLHIAGNGDVRLCTYTDPIGNIQTHSYPELLKEPAWAESLQTIRQCRTNCHFMVNCCYQEDSGE